MKMLTFATCSALVLLSSVAAGSADASCAVDDHGKTDCATDVLSKEWFSESGAKITVESENGIAEINGILYTESGERAFVKSSSANSAELAPYWPLHLVEFTDAELEFGAVFARENSIELPLPIEKYWRSFADMPTMLVSMYPKLKKSDVWVEKGDGASAGTVVSYPSTNTGSVHITDRLKLELLERDDDEHLFTITIPEANTELSYYKVRFKFDEPKRRGGRPTVSLYIEVTAVKEEEEGRKPSLAVCEMVTFKRLTDMNSYVLREEGATVQASRTFENVTADAMFQRFSDWKDYSYFVSPRVRSAKHKDYFRRELVVKGRDNNIEQDLIAVDPARKTLVFQDYWTESEVYGAPLAVSLSSYTMQEAGENGEHTTLTHTLTYMSEKEGREERIREKVRSRVEERLERLEGRFDSVLACHPL